MSEVFDGVLDLTGADETAGSFDAIPAGTYSAHVHEAVWKATSNPDGTKALPDQTPYLNIQMAIDDEENNGTKVKNRRVFGKVFVPTEGAIPAEKLSYHRGTMLNFLKAVGYTAEQLNKKGFRLDPDELAGKQLTVVVSRVKNSHTGEWDNDVKGYKLAGEGALAGSGSPI
jgi:hypothetical protein